MSQPLLAQGQSEYYTRPPITWEYVFWNCCETRLKKYSASWSAQVKRFAKTQAKLAGREKVDCCEDCCCYCMCYMLPFQPGNGCQQYQQSNAIRKKYNLTGGPNCVEACCAASCMQDCVLKENAYMVDMMEQYPPSGVDIKTGQPRDAQPAAYQVPQNPVAATMDRTGGEQPTPYVAMVSK
eukprot:g1436.t1